jgi:uncharacterized membrane protein YgaE (UPF0421/DUF939 family)
MLPVLVRRPADLLGVQLAWRDHASDAKHRLLAALWPSAQAAASAGLAWYIAHDLLGHAQPFFAPIAAAISLSSSGTRRGRRIVQMVVGVTLGIAVGEAAAALVGTGALQIAAVVAATMAAALLTGIGFFSEGMMFVNQSVASAILVVALRKHGTGAERLVDALVGGGVAGVVGVGLFPSDPLAVIRDAEREVLRSLSGALAEVARLLSSGTAAPAGWALAAAQDVHRQLAQLADARRTARATARIAPRRWHLRAAVAMEDARISHFDLMANAALSLFRAATGALDDGEPIPASLSGAVDDLAAALAALTDSPQPWADRVLAQVRDLVAATLGAVDPQTVPRAPVLANLVRATARDVLRVLPLDAAQAQRPS